MLSTHIFREKILELILKREQTVLLFRINSKTLGLVRAKYIS